MHNVDRFRDFECVCPIAIILSGTSYFIKQQRVVATSEKSSRFNLGQRINYSNNCGKKFVANSWNFDRK